MRQFLFILILLPIWVVAQTPKRQTGSGQTESVQTGSRPVRASSAKPAEYSASSEWQRVTLKPTPRLDAQTARRTASAEPRSSVERSTVNQPAEPVAANVPAAKASGPDGPGLDRPAATNVPSAVGGGTAGSRTARSGAFRPAFTGDFSTNRNGWKAGNQGDYNFQIGLGRYSMRKRNANTKQVAFSYVPLPPDINLNRADTFSIRVDVLADSGQVPTGGVLFGVRDSLNYCAFTTNSRGEISIKRVLNGTVLSDYMPGDYFRPGVLLDKNRNRLIIKRRGDALHFYVNDQEVRSSPYPFRILSGNGIGLMASGYWTQFQKLNVALGP